MEIELFIFMSSLAMYIPPTTHAVQLFCIGVLYLRKCQLWLTSRPWVMFKVLDIRLEGSAEQIWAGTACPIGFLGLLSRSNAVSAKLQLCFIAVWLGKKWTYSGTCTILLIKIYSWHLHSWFPWNVWFIPCITLGILFHIPFKQEESVLCCVFCLPLTPIEDACFEYTTFGVVYL